jgi:hypothetical protein
MLTSCKIKCNRTRPTCEACQVFNCPCIYDAVPKKRGPKTDVLEALLKRVDGLEKRLVSEGKSDDPSTEADPASAPDSNIDTKPLDLATSQSPHEISPGRPSATNHANQLMSPIEPRYVETTCTAELTPLLIASSTQSPTLSPDLLLDTYFARIHGKPYYILDESTTRQRLQANQLPAHLAYAIYAVSARYVVTPMTMHNTINKLPQICTPLRRIWLCSAHWTRLCPTR